MYQFTGNIRYSEVDSSSQLTWLALLDYFQDCSAFHSESLGLGVRWLADHHSAWILLSWQICVNRLPLLAEPVKIQTWPYQMKGFFGLRNFAMLGENDEILAYANSVWAYMDTRTGHMQRMNGEVLEAYRCDPPLEMDYCGRKLPVPDTYTESESFVVPSYFIDTNHHMNNSRYVQTAMEYLPPDFQICELRVEYKKEAVCGNRITPRITDEGNVFTVNLADQDGKSYAVVQFLSEKAGMGQTAQIQ